MADHQSHAQAATRLLDNRGREAAAQVHALLAIAEEQRTANLITYLQLGLQTQDMSARYRVPLSPELQAADQLIRDRLDFPEQANV